MRVGSAALRTPRSGTLRAALAGVVVLGLAGCLKADADLAVSSDNTVDGTLIVAVDESLLAITGQSEEEFLDQFLQGAGPLGQEAPESGSVEQERYSEEGKLGARYRLSDIPLAEFNEGDGDESVRIVRDGDKFRVSGVLDLSNPADLTGTPLGEQAQALLRDAEIRVKLTFPGDVESATGAVDGNSVTWAPKFGERVETVAVADARSGSLRPPGRGDGHRPAGRRCARAAAGRRPRRAAAGTPARPDRDGRRGCSRLRGRRPLRALHRAAYSGPPLRCSTGRRSAAGRHGAAARRGATAVPPAARTTARTTARGSALAEST